MPRAFAESVLRQQAREIFRAGVAAADPRERVLEALEIRKGGRPVLAGETLPPGGRLRVVAIGKAAVSMAAAVCEVLSKEIFRGDGIAIVDRENHRELPRFLIEAAEHPVPGPAGAAAARRLASYVKGAAPGDGLLVLISGGGSALVPAPATGVTLADKVEATRQLLACGADIQEINSVRKHLSNLKGGGLARLAGPARTEALILSDVIGDDAGTVASGPTAPDPTTFREALEVLARHGIASTVPAPVSERLAQGDAGLIAETPKAGDPAFDRVANRVIGGNGRSLDAAAAKAADLGFRVEIVSRELAGEARAAGAGFVAKIAEISGPGRPVALLAGGETTVTVRGGGRGGRNQEMAAATALAARDLPGETPDWVFLSGGTDGRDGPTDAAGGLVDAGTAVRCAAAGLDLAAGLADNDSHGLLAATGDLLVTGPTGTNVGDLQVLLVAPA